MKKTLLLILTLIVGFYTEAQTPQTSATLDMTLQCAGGTNNRTGIAFNPVDDLYYSVNAGSSNYPIETFDVTGNQVASVSQGFDYRGAWWNPNTSVLEGNGYNTLGIWIQNLDGSGYALGTGTNDVSGSGPDPQSSANYDFDNDEVIHYFNGQIYRYDRATYTLISSYAITGLPSGFGDLNSNSVAYTGVTGMEIGVYDRTNKAFYFIDKANGAYVMTCQLPATAPAAAQFQMGYANGRLWLYDTSTSQWKGYITVSLCSETTSSITASACSSYTVPSGDETHTSSGVYNDTIPNAEGCDSIMTIDLTILQATSGTDVITSCDSITWIDGNTYTADNNTATDTLTNADGCDSIVTLNLTINTVDIGITNNSPTLLASANPASFQWVDCDENYSSINGETSSEFTASTNGNYAVIITQNGCTDTTECEIVANIGLETNYLGNQVSLYPNPTNGNMHVNSSTQIEQIRIYDATGQLIFDKVVNDNDFFTNLDTISKGIYLISIYTIDGRTTKRLVKN